jgi:hypothetical protein
MDIKRTRKRNKVSPVVPTKIVGSPSEVKAALDFERHHGFDPEIVFWKRLDAWKIEVWAY